MAEVISDFGSDSSRFHHSHTMIGGSGPQLSPPESQYRQRSRTRTGPPPSPRTQPTSIPAGTPPRSTGARATVQPPAEDVAGRTTSVRTEPPSPPSSSSPNPESSRPRFTGQSDFVQPAQYEGAFSDTRPQASSNHYAGQASVTRSARSLDNITQYGGNTIKVRDLAHIQSFATEEFLSYRGQSGRRRTADDPTLKYEISGMPITDIIEMVAGLLTKITTTNDRQHENLHRPLPTGDVNMTGLSSSVLAFHGKNVPSITILSYLSRIHKYCPTTYEVFLSLLVYFDRMTERVNASPLQALNKENMEQDNSRPSSGYSAEGSDLADSPPSSRSAPEIHSDLERAQYTHAPPTEPDPFPLSHFFVVDSFNIHRLVIAGVTCASKFFSDVFYTNSRYAKVGGLPLAELNHLELQFLLLNDFRLSVPVEELEAYGTMLVEFYAREVIAQRQGQIPMNMSYPEDMEVVPQSP
ncbi:cyclin-domain-containing protein [Acephala macrosclerotiorum]|nr:cyclin-domain-containing protein [Acephala macrosclerotiorum]